MASSKGLFLRAITLLAFSCVVFAAQENSAPIFSTYQGKGAALEVSKTGPEYTSIRFDGSALERRTIVQDFEEFDFIGIDGEAIVTEDGSPAVPHVSRYYRIPATGGANLVVMSADFELVEDYNAMPYYEEERLRQQNTKNPMIYGQDAWFPENIAEMSEPMIMRDFRVVIVRLNPVQVNPVTRQARIYHNIQVDIVPNNEPSVNEMTRVRRPSGMWSSMYQHLIENLDEHALDDATTTPGTYIILAKDHATVNQWTDSLYLWKKRSGHDVILEKRTSWSAPQMTTFIRSAYANADEDSPVEFVCIMGDPANEGTYGMPTDGSNYDHTFALATTGDDIEDIGVGRICATNTSEFATINAKIAAYERTPNLTDPGWFRRAFLYAGVANQIASNYTTMQWVGQQLRLHTDIDSSFVASHPGAVNNNTIWQQFNGGVGIFLWRGTWLNQMDASSANGCNNGTKLPVCMTVTCNTGNFTNGLATSESWVVAGTATSPKGGVACVGMATTSTHHPENICVTGGLGYAIANLRTEHFGHCVNSAKAWLHTTFGWNAPTAQNFSKWFNLMGDPGLSIWSDSPQVVEVTHTGSLIVGSRSLTVHVADDITGNPVEGALVTAWKGTECYVKGLTNANGDLVLPVTVDSPGTLLLTATKRNMNPYLADVACAAGTEYVAFSSMTVDDDNAGGTQGNGDGIMNPGEIVDLAVVLRNSGSSVIVTGITAALTTTSPRATVVQGSSTFSNLAPGAQAMGATAFRLNLSNDLQFREVVPLRFAVTSSGTPTTSTVEAVISAARPQYISHSFSSAFGPGLTRDMTVTVKNTGVVPLTGVTATLISGSPFVSATTANATYPNIPVNSQVTNTASPFTLNANSLTFPGHQAPMTLILTGNNGFVDTTYFNVPVGTAASDDPCGPDGFGYYAYDNIDNDYELHPQYSYVNISSGLGTDLNIDDVGEKTEITQVWAVARALPFPFTYYGVEYDSITICANGWVAFGAQAFGDHFRNYPIPAQAAPMAMVAPYWDDLKTSGAGQGVWWYHDVDADRLIIQWKASGGGSSYNTANLDFEVILLGQTLTPTLDGNGRILFQYNDVTMNMPGNGGENPGCTIGIQDSWGTSGLALAYINTLSSGCASLMDGRAILITTDARNLFGTVVGTVTDEETGQPMENVNVTADGFNYSALTNAQGQYTLDNVLIGEYVFRAHAEGYNDALSVTTLVELDSTETVNFSMFHPELELSTDELTIAYPAQSSATFEIINDGNGPLAYNIRMAFMNNGEETQNWDAIDHVGLSEQTGDFQMLGCEFAGDYWYVSGGAGPTGTNWIYRFDRAGQLVPPAIPQPSTSAFGWYDLAYDGQYLYGSEDGTGVINGIDLNGVIRAEIQSPLNPTRAIAHDPALDHFWVGDFTQNIYQIDRDGNVFAEVENDGANELAITGLAWWAQDPNGYKLYIFSRDGETNQTRVTRMHPITYDRQTVAVLEGTEYASGGCGITSRYNDMLVTFGGVLQSNTGDQLGIYQMMFDQSWATITPAVGTVPGFQRREITMNCNFTNFRSAHHTVSLFLSNDVLNTTIELPVTIDVLTAIGDHPGDDLIPRAYSLSQNYPNPFNPSTTIHYTLKEAALTTLSVYNIRGQQVAQLVNGQQSAGAYNVNFDASGLPSGMYFYRLESGDFSQAAKMILLK